MTCSTAAATSSEASVRSVARKAIETAMLVSAPILGLSLIVGLLVSTFQAMTQINEATLTFVPKMVIIFGTLAALGPWLGQIVLRFTEMCFEGFPMVLK